MIPVFALTSLLAAGSALGAVPHASYPRLISANGLGVVVLTEREDGSAVLDRFSDRLYQQRSAEEGVVRDLLYDAYFGLRIGSGAGHWLVEGSPDYLPGTPIITVDRSREGLRLTEQVVAPMTLDHPGYLQLLEVHNGGTDSTQPVSIFVLQNHHLGQPDGEGQNTVGERILWQDGALQEWGDGTGLGMTTLPLAPDARVGCRGVWQAVQDGEDLDGVCDDAGTDRVGALQWELGVLAPGETRVVGVLHAFSSGWSTGPMVGTLQAWLGSATAAQRMADQQAWWQAWLGESLLPDGVLTEDELAVHDQALVFLKMAQVREPGAAYGQIPASLPASAPVGDFQHEWNITWVRDGAYAIRALSLAGHHEEAQAALAFQIQPGCCGLYAGHLGLPDYAISACRYYGDGSEWSDSDADGPNIELDNFGLFLWAFVQEVHSSGDLGFAEEHAEGLLAGVADRLAAADDPVTGLVTADSSIWERHWNGRQKRFTYTSLWAVVGLREAAWLADQLGESSRADGYRSRADVIAAAIEASLTDDDGVLAGSFEELQAGGGYLDLAAVDALALSVVDPQGEIAHASLDRWLRDLAVESGGGLRRNDDGDLYDIQEWIWADLRTAAALRRACRVDEAARLEAWVLDNAMLNRRIIPELLHPETADYAGPAPMMGFGSGLWVLGLHDREAAAVACAGGEDGAGDGGSDDADGTDGGDGEDGGSGSSTGDDGGLNQGPATPASPTGCGCGTGAPPLGTLLILSPLLGLLARRRRDI